MRRITRETFRRCVRRFFLRWKKRLYDLAETQLKTEMTQKYQLTEVELNLLWEMSRMTKEKEVFQISTNVETFELILNDLEKINEERLDALVTLREKLNFNSGNPKLIVTTSRQLAVGTELQIYGKISGEKKHQNRYTTACCDIVVIMLA